MVGDDTDLKLRTLDRVYNKIDKLYGGFAYSCGVSSCAYWMLFEISHRGSVALVELTDAWSYSKQTINSALKSLQEKGLVDVCFCEGSRKNKVASLTDEGKEFAAKYLDPAEKAERRAFERLKPGERELIADLMEKYASYLDDELQKVSI